MGGGSGINIKSLNQKTLGSLSVPFPPLSEQHAIVSKLDALSAETKRLEDVYQRKLAAQEEMRKSILQKAFAGEL